ncbi:MAG: efflux RND transporter periplasmic adaptor subunit [Bacteroidales bacterium]|nr:efflux RND transporter periplasmic adaptor subunit [Bacteroidales bacterium]
MKKKILIISSIVAILAISAAVWFVMKSNQQVLVFNTKPAEDGHIEVIITATGEIQPVTQVEVGTQVSGVIEKLHVDFNSVVTKGQLLAEIDKSTLIEQNKQARASVSDAEGNLTFAQQNYDRVKILFDKKASTQTTIEEAVNKLISAKNQYTTAKSNLQKSEVNLSYAVIYSPISGVILNRAVDEGQTVAASFNTPTLFTIANDLTKMQVEANVDEADIGQVKVGQTVTFTVDAFPDDLFRGTVQSLRLQPTVISNVVTYTVIIEAPNPDQKLFPGMTASTSIIVQQAEGIVIPAEVFNFNPDGDLLRQIEQQEVSISMLTEKPGAKQSVIWIKNGSEMRQQIVTKGLSDRTSIHIENGLKKGDTVVLSVNKVKAAKTAEVANPFMPTPPKVKTR